MTMANQNKEKILKANENSQWIQAISREQTRRTKYLALHLIGREGGTSFSSFYGA